MSHAAGQGDGPFSPATPAGCALAPGAGEDLTRFLGRSDELLGVVGPAGVRWVHDGDRALLGDAPPATALADLVHPDDLGAVTEMLGRVSPRAEPAAVLARARRRDGAWRWLEWRARIDPGSGLLCTAARDVTDRERVHEAIAATETQLQALVDNSPAAVFAKDRHGRYVLANESFLHALGVEGSHVLGRTVQEIWPGVPVEDADRRVLAGETITRDDVVELADGPHVVMTVRFPLLDAGGRITGMAGIATDITDWTKVEAALAERQRLLDTVVRACPDIVTVLDGEGRVQEISEASARILGYDMSDPVHEDIVALVHPDDRTKVVEEYARILSMRDAQLDVRYRVRHADGRWVVLDTRGQAILGEDGRAVGVVVVSRDVTSELAVEAQMRAAVEAAEHASLVKSEFLSRMSHELRTPLNSVLGFSQLLEMDELPAHQGQAVGHVMRAGRHLLKLIDEVLDISRIESGNLELLIEQVSVGDVIGDAVDLAGPLAERRHIDVVVDLGHGGTGHVLADRQRLLQVLLNLLSNAVKYNRTGGRVDVAVEARGSRVAIVVADTGTGISPDDIGRVFEPFDRLGAEHSSVEGTGVGLTLSKHLVERMGGSIEVESVYGESTAFIVELPASEAPVSPERGAEQRPAGQPGSRALRVLHVEDNLANLELVEQVLDRSGVVELHTAMSGTVGLALARQHVPDLILLDLHLPDIPGTEILERLQEDRCTAGIPVVVVTADATPPQIRRVRECGVAAYLTKPIDVRELLRVVESVAAGAGSPA